MRRRPDDAHRPPRGRSRARRAGPPVQRRLADAKWRPAASWAQCTRRLSAPDALAGRSLILAMRRRYSGASETGRGGSGPPSAAEVRYRAESPSIVPAVYPARSTVGGTVARDPHRCRGIGAAGSSLAISGVPISGAPVESKGGILNDVGIDSGIADMSERSMRTRPDRGYLRRIGLGNFSREPSRDAGDHLRPASTLGGGWRGRASGPGAESPRGRRADGALQLGRRVRPCAEPRRVPAVRTRSARDRQPCPLEVWLAIPHKARPPRVSGVRVRLLRFSGAAWALSRAPKSCDRLPNALVGEQFTPRQMGQP